MSLGNIRGEVPIHGFVTTTDLWRVVALRATSDNALVTSRLEFYRQPAWMRRWPYAHTIEIIYRLAGGVLEVATAIANLSSDPMPVAIGFHPYFQVTDAPRDEWHIAVAAKTGGSMRASCPRARPSRQRRCCRLAARRASDGCSC